MDVSIDAVNASGTVHRMRTLDCAVCLAVEPDNGFASPAATVYAGTALCVTHFRERLQQD